MRFRHEEKVNAFWQRVSSYAGQQIFGGCRNGHCAGDSEGDPANRHRGADQWLFVVAGTGTAIVNDKRHPLRQNVLILIERGDRHQIVNTGPDLLRTLNIYVPPAYTKGGNTLPKGRR